MMSTSSFERLDPKLVEATLSAPPFVAVEGVINIRALPNTPPGGRAIFRSGEISRITPEGKAQLRALGVKKVFDFRSPREMARFQTPMPDIEGIEVVNMPAITIERSEDLGEAFALFASGGEEGFLDLYAQILEQGAQAFTAIFKHIKDKPDEPFLFHCTGGKDRTGVAAALILTLLGVDDETIANDYALTRIGVEPAADLIMARYSSLPNFNAILPVLENLFSSRHSTMLATLQMLRDKYGGARGYLRTFCGLKDEDISMIEAILTGQSKAD